MVTQCKFEIGHFGNLDLDNKSSSFFRCLENTTKDCFPLSRYKFTLTFENSNCEYTTEKLWLNAYAKNAIPIVVGTAKKFYKQLLPPNSYIITEDLSTPRDLANYIFYLNNSLMEFKNYFAWKTRFKVLNEHKYFETDSINYCRICEALNYNSKEEKVYNDLETYWNKKHC